MENDWEPPPGMTKLVCTGCGHTFAAAGKISVCPTCSAGIRTKKAHRVSESPFDGGGSTGHHIYSRGFGKGWR